MDGDDRHVVRIGFLKRFEIWQLGHAGRAPRRPEVDHDHLPALLGECEVAARAVQRHSEVRAAHAFLETLGWFRGRSGRNILRAVYPGAHACEQRQRNDPRGSSPRAPDRGQRTLSAFHRNGLSRAHLRARAAVNALVVSHAPHVHPAARHTAPAAAAFFRVHLHAHDCQTREHSVNRAQRAEKTAERAVHKHTGRKDSHQNNKLPREQASQHGKQALVRRVGK